MQRIINLLEEIINTNRKIEAETNDGYVYVQATSSNKIFISHDIRQTDGKFATRQIWGNINDMAAYLLNCGIKL